MKHSFRENPIVRRAVIVAMVVIAVPVVVVIAISEIVWKTAKSVLSITKQVIAEDIPALKHAINYIREIW